MQNISFWIAFGGTLSLTLFAYWTFRRVTVSVDESTEKLVIAFGKLTRRLDRPGLHWVPEALWPWVKVLSVSKQLQYRTIKNIQVNDHFGTTVAVDLFVEFKITDPCRALFSVDDWEEVLRSTVVHSTASILCSQTIEEILQQRNQLSGRLQEAIAREIERWGIHLQGAVIQNIGVLPEVAKQFFRAVGARIERTQALVEEQGRLRVQQLDAQTALHVAELTALAESQLPLEIGKFYRNLATDPTAQRRFAEFWDLHCLDPRKTVAFQGFEEDPLRAVEAIHPFHQTVERPMRT